MTEPTQPGSTGEAFPRFSWWRVLVGAALPLILMAAYFQLISLVLHPELPFNLEGFFTCGCGRCYWACPCCCWASWPRAFSQA